MKENSLQTTNQKNLPLEEQYLITLKTGRTMTNAYRAKTSVPKIKIGAVSPVLKQK